MGLSLFIDKNPNKQGSPTLLISGSDNLDVVEVHDLIRELKGFESKLALLDKLRSTT